MSVGGDTSRGYVVITPCKDEGKNLPNLIESMIVQTIQPIVWVIVDDGSTDDTSNIVENAVRVHDWIQSVRLDSVARDLGLHFARITKDGFDIADRYCAEKRIRYDYVAKVDGDVTLPIDFFENLINEFEVDSKLGVASGTTKHIIGNTVQYAEMSVNEPSGGHMLIRSACFEECGGFPLTYATDSVIKAKARLRGWKTTRFEENIATESRDVHAAEGYWKGYIHKGESSYYLGVNPFHVIARSVIYSFRRPFYTGIGYLVGYLRSALQRAERVDDLEIRDYFSNKWKTVIRREFLKMQDAFSKLLNS